jgi:hypothetical protein
MNLKPRKMLGWVLVVGLCLLPVAASAFSVKDVQTKIQLPSSAWTLDKEYTGNDVLVGMYVTQLGRAVSIRANYYDYPYTPTKYLTGVREKLMEKEEYKGGDFQVPQEKTIGGKTWSYFKLVRKDEIIQELWAMKDANGAVLFVIFTTAGNDYFKKYYSDFTNFITQISNMP